MTKPSVLILGGTGFIGRNLVRYLVKNDLCSKVRASDKNKPEMAWFNPADQDAFKNPVVEYVMSNLCNKGSVEKTFDNNGSPFDFVINLAAVGPYGQDPDYYQNKLLELVRLCGNEAKKTGVKRWIEVSTAQVYKPTSKTKDEKGPIAPYTSLAKSKFDVEKLLKEIGIPHIIVRPAIVYGPGDVTGLMPRLVIGRVYKKTGEEMKFLWSGSLQINTVHVNDVCKALWFLLQNGQEGEIYNLADSNKTNQEMVNKMISEIFGIKTGFVGSIMSNFAKMNFKAVVEDVNETHLEPWGGITKETGINRTPLSPFLEPELLSNDDLAIDGTKITKLGFTYDVPKPTTELLRESIQYWMDINAFPKW